MKKKKNPTSSVRLAVFLAVLGLLVLVTGMGYPVTRQVASTTNRMRGHHFIMTVDGRDLCNGPPLGEAQEWIRTCYRRIFAAGVTVFVGDVATPDLVVTKDTPTGEIVAARFDNGQGEDKLDKRYRVIKELMRQNTDVLHILSEEGRKAKALVLAGMRMSDAHHGVRWKPRSDSIHTITWLFPKFVLDHPEWCNTWEDGSRDATLNYALPEVQAHRLQILRELATHYDIDGLELDWMRHCRYFPAGRQKEHLKDLTHFVGQVRTMLDEVSKKRGVARMILGHRVPVTMEESLNIGLDLGTWAKQGYADFLVPMDFHNVDPNARTDEFVQALRGTPCLVYTGFGASKYSAGDWYTPRASSRRRTAALGTLEQFRAVAANGFAWGATGGAFYNLWGWEPERQEFATAAIAIMSDPGKALAGPRHYLFVPIWKGFLSHYERLKRYGEEWRKFVRPGDEEGPGVGIGPTGRHNAQSLVFTSADVGARQTFTFRMADGKGGEKLQGWLRLRFFDATPDDTFSIDLNGKAIPLEKFSIVHLPGGELSGRTARPFGVPEDGTFDWPPNLRYEISLENCPPFRGDNEFGVTLVKKSRESGAKLVMEAVEVMVR